MSEVKRNKWTLAWQLGLVLVVVLSIPAYLFLWNSWSKFFPWGLLCVVFVVAMLMLNFATKFGEADYLSLPDSTDHRCKVRCIYCGHVGVYKHGEYASNTKWHDCSKCETTLFTS